MTAEQLFYRHGHELLGRMIHTESIGEYPGGPAVVVELEPDKAAPEIIFTVRHKTFGEIGVFEHEEVELLSGPEFLDVV